MAISIEHAELGQEVFASQDPLRLGVVGVGDVAQRDYLPEIDRLKPEAVVVAVAAAAEERGRETARRLAIPRWYVGYEGLIADEEVECVIDLAPAPLHEEVNGAAIEAGKALHSEKPLALTAAAARSLGAAADTRGLSLTAAPSVLVFPQVKMVGSLLRSGGLGTPVAASGAAFGGVPPWEGFASDPTPYFAEGVGPLVDLGVYPLHALTGLLGPVRRVAALGRRTREAFEVLDGPGRGTRVPVAEDDVAQLVLELGGGVLASVHVNFATAPSSAPELEILGDAGGVACSLLDPASPVRSGGGDGWTELPVPAERTAGPDHILGIRHLVRCVRGLERPLLTAGHAAHVLDVIEAARQSTAEGRIVNVPDTGWTPVTSEEG
jgi:predicted dehydrogenase